MRIWWWQTTWVVLVPITTHLPSFINVVHIELWIFDFFDANEVLNMRIWWRQTTRVVLVPITTHIPSFINVAHTKLWIFDFLLLANQNRYANEVLNMRIRWQHTTWVVLVPPPTTHIRSLTKIGHCVLIREWRFTFWYDEIWHTSICTYISDRPLQMKTKWSFQHSWRPTTNKQTNP